MSLPGGIGASDIITACKFIYDICMKYKAAREEFEEIAEKTRATENVIERLEIEAATGGSLIERADDDGRAEKEFQEHLDGLRSDLDKLQKLVGSYASIHDEGKGRRLLWAVWESGNLTEYRRKIGYHEQKLQFWYMTLVYGSLRRLETGQDEMIEGMNELPKSLEKMINDAIKKNNDFGPLIKALERRGLPPEITRNRTNLRLASTYFNSSKEDKCKLTDHVHRMSQEPRTSGMYDTFHTPRNSRDTNYYPTRDSTQTKDSKRRQSEDRYRPYHTEDFWWPGDENIRYESKREHRRSPDTYDKSNAALGVERPSGVRRSKSARQAHKPKVEDDPEFIRVSKKDDQAGGQEKTREEKLRPGHTRRASDTPRLQRAKSPLIIISDDGPHERIDISHRRTRSTSQTRRPSVHDDVPVIIVEEEVPRRSRSRAGSESNSLRHRDSSTGSYHRARDRSSSAGSGVNVRQYRVVKKMERIDSMPVDEDKRYE